MTGLATAQVDTKMNGVRGWFNGVMADYQHGKAIKDCDKRIQSCYDTFQQLQECKVPQGDSRYVALVNELQNELRTMASLMGYTAEEAKVKIRTRYVYFDALFAAAKEPEDKSGMVKGYLGAAMAFVIAATTFAAADYRWFHFLVTVGHGH